MSCSLCSAMSTFVVAFYCFTGRKDAKLSCRRGSARCHSRSLNVIRCCANRRGISDLLLALNINLLSFYIQQFLGHHAYIACTSTPALLFQVELAKDGWEQVDMLRCHGAQNIGLHNHKLKSALAPYDHNARPSQTNRQTDEHHGNSATNCSNERIAR